MLKNEKGSVLSVAIIMIVILSFAITTTSVYSFNIAQRTQENISTQNEDLLARALIDQARNDMKYFISELNPKSFSELDTSFEDTAYIELLEDIYAPVEITLITVSEENLSRRYRFSYTKVNGNIITRDLLISLAGTTIPVNTPLVDGMDELINQIKSDENTEVFQCDGGACTKETIASLTGNNQGTLTFTSVVEDSLDLFMTGKQGQFDLNGNTLIVEGNLTLENIAHLKGPGVVIVTGTLIQEQDFSMEIENEVLFLVKETVNITYTHNSSSQRQLDVVNNSSRFLFLSAKTENYLTNVEIMKDYDDTSSNPSNPTFYTGIAENPTFRYISNKPYNQENWLDFFDDFNIEIQQGFQFSENSFQETSP